MTVKQDGKKLENAIDYQLTPHSSKPLNTLNWCNRHFLSDTVNQERKGMRKACCEPQNLKMNELEVILFQSQYPYLLSSLFYPTYFDIIVR